MPKMSAALKQKFSQLSTRPDLASDSVHLDRLADTFISENRVKGREDDCLTERQMRKRQSKEMPMGADAERVPFRQRPAFGDPL